MSSRIRVVIVATFCLLLGVWGAVQLGWNTRASVPNVIFVVMDGVGADRVVLCRNTGIETKNIQAFSERSGGSYTCGGTWNMSVVPIVAKALAARGYRNAAYSTSPDSPVFLGTFQSVRAARKWGDYGSSRRFGSGLRRVLGGLVSDEPVFLLVHIATDPSSAAEAAVFAADLRLGVVIAQLDAGSFCDRGCRIVVAGSARSGPVPVLAWGAAEDLSSGVAISGAALGELVAGP